MSYHGITGVEVKTGFCPLAFFLFFCTPRIEIDGQVYKKRWGTHFFELPPGSHKITVYFRYLFMSRCGENSIPVEVAPGAVARVRYNMPPWMLAKGSLVETVDRWRIFRNLVEERIQEQLGEAEAVLALVGTRKGHFVLALVATLLLLPLTILLMALLVIPGLIWLLHLGARDSDRIVRAGGSGAAVKAMLVLSFLFGVIPGSVALMYWIVFPLFDIKFVFVAKTVHSIVLVPFYNIFNVPTLMSVTVLPEGHAAIQLVPPGSMEPKMILSGTSPYRELEVIKWGRDDRDQFRDLQVLAGIDP